MGFRVEYINHCNIKDVNVPNEAFEVFGKLVPSFNNSKWSYVEELLESPYVFQFPNDKTDYSEYISDKSKTMIFIYSEESCVGQIRIRENWNRFCFIEDIAVSKNYRKSGLGKLLLQSAEQWARERDLKGFMLEAQDFNLNACRFYSHQGFVLGSVDNMLYYNTPSRNDLALFWYKVF